jgi:hypothetical protein
VPRLQAKPVPFVGMSSQSTTAAWLSDPPEPLPVASGLNPSLFTPPPSLHAPQFLNDLVDGYKARSIRLLVVNPNQRVLRQLERSGGATYRTRRAPYRTLRAH